MKILISFLLIAAVLMMGACVERASEESFISTEVLIVGGGVAGVAAAIQAARTGAEVVLVEETTWLGGMMTAAGVSAIDGNHQLPSGLWGEFRSHLYQHYGGPGAVATGWVSNTQFEPDVGDQIWKSMVGSEEKIKVLYGYYPVQADMEGEMLTAIRFKNQEGQDLKVEAKVTIDATELGDLLPQTGTPYRLGQDARSETGELLAPEKPQNIIQDLTWVAILKDYGQGKAPILSRSPNFDPLRFNCSNADFCDDLDTDVVDAAKMLDYGKLPNGYYMINWPINGNDFYVNAVEEDREKRQASLEKAKAETLDFVSLIQKELGFDHLGIADDVFPTEDHLAIIPYHRESRRVVGHAMVTLNHLSDPYIDANYRQSISVGDYPVDHHHDKKPGFEKIKFPPVPAFSIPYGALVPKTTEGLLVAEKSYSVSHLANGSTRLQPVVLLTGQAAGAAAALSVAGNVRPSQLNIRELQSELLEAGCWLMPYRDVPPSHPNFIAIQKTALSGLMRGEGIPEAWANKALFYPDSILSSRDMNFLMEHETINSFTTDAEFPPADGPVTLGVLLKIIKAVKSETPLNEIHELNWDEWAKVIPEWEENDGDARLNKPLTRAQAASVLDLTLGIFDQPLQIK